MQAFFKKYDFNHEVLCVAADGPSNVSFSFVADTVSILLAFQLLAASGSLTQHDPVAPQWQ